MSLPYEFDHLVVIGRDQMPRISDCFQALGFHLTPLARHNLGSMNRLIMLNTAYIELLGWELGEMPARKEIANEPIGLNALVFRTQNADACYEALAGQGYCPNPVQELTRPVQVGGKTQQAVFRTVRFSAQPIEGLRIYFCQHLTPQHVWRPQDMSHPNQLNELAEIVLESSEPQALYSKLCALLCVSTERASLSLPAPDRYRVSLGNCGLRIVASDSGQPAAIQGCRIESAQAARALSFGNEVLQQ
jgi:hypothetical protein